MNRIPDGSLYPVAISRYTGGPWPAAQRADTGRFDQFQLSPRPAGEDKRVMDLSAHVSQQVRSRHTAGEIARLKQQIQEGTYQPDPREIAARMLMEDL